MVLPGPRYIPTCERASSTLAVRVYVPPLFLSFTPTGRAPDMALRPPGVCNEKVIPWMTLRSAAAINRACVADQGEGIISSTGYPGSLAEMEFVANVMAGGMVWAVLCVASLRVEGPGDTGNLAVKA